MIALNSFRTKIILRRAAKLNCCVSFCMVIYMLFLSNFLKPSAWTIGKNSVLYENRLVPPRLMVPLQSRTFFWYGCILIMIQSSHLYLSIIWNKSFLLLHDCLQWEDFLFQTGIFSNNTATTNVDGLLHRLLLLIYATYVSFQWFVTCTSICVIMLGACKLITSIAFHFKLV